MFVCVCVCMFCVCVCVCVRARLRMTGHVLAHIHAWRARARDLKSSCGLARARTIFEPLFWSRARAHGLGVIMFLSRARALAWSRAR